MNARKENTKNIELFFSGFCTVYVINFGLYEFRLLE